MDGDTKSRTGKEAIAVARKLGDWQNTGCALSPRMVTRIVNALLSSGNTLEHEARTAGFDSKSPIPGFKVNDVTPLTLNHVSAPAAVPVRSKRSWWRRLLSW